MAMKRLLLAVIALLPILALLASWELNRRQELHERQERERLERQSLADFEGLKQLLNSDLGESHPLWTPPKLCPARPGIEPTPARYPGLNFCPPVLVDIMRNKLDDHQSAREFDLSERKAWNAEPRDILQVLAEYWVLDAAAFISVIGAHEKKLSKWLVNVGARPTSLAPDGMRLPTIGDDVTMLWPMGYSGINFELPEYLHMSMEFYWRWPKARVDVSGVTPDAMLRRMQELGVPKDLDLVKIDIDSFDCEFLVALLDGGFRPKVVTMELGASFPPPLRFRIKMEGYSVNLTRYTVLQGCSLQYAYDVLRPMGYTLIQYNVEDGWFVLDEYAHLFGRLHTSPSDLYDLGNPFLVQKWPWPEFQWSLTHLRSDPEKMLALARKGLEAIVTLRPGLETVQYELEVADGQ